MQAEWYGDRWDATNSNMRQQARLPEEAFELGPGGKGGDMHFRLGEGHEQSTKLRVGSVPRKW